MNERTNERLKENAMGGMKKEVRIGRFERFKRLRDRPTDGPSLIDGPTWPPINKGFTCFSIVIAYTEYRD